MELFKENAGNAELCFKVIDNEDRMSLDFIASPMKVSVGREIIAYLEGHSELEFQIN